MTDTNSHMTAALAGLNIPTAFTDALTAAADDPARVQVLINLIEQEGTSPDDHRFWLDEMSPACRDWLSKFLRAVKASVT